MQQKIQKSSLYYLIKIQKERSKIKQSIYIHILILLILVIGLCCIKFYRNYSKTIKLRESAVIESIEENKPLEIEQIQTREKEVKIPVIVLDAGHGGKDVGSSRENILEKDINLSITLKVRKLLIQKGYQVVLTREGDHFVGLKDRVDIANKSQADIYVSIHQNAFEDRGVHGIETWYSEQKGEDNEILASLLHSTVIEKTNARKRYNNGNSDMYGVINTNMPACIIETGFLSNTTERKKLITEEYQNTISGGIAEAIISYFSEYKQLYTPYTIQQTEHLKQFV